MDGQARDQLLTRAFSDHGAACHDLTTGTGTLDAQRVIAIHGPIDPPEGHPDAARYRTAWLMLEVGGGQDWVLQAWRIVRDRLLRGVNVHDVVHAHDDDDVPEGDTRGPLADHHDGDRPPPPTLVLADTLARHAPPRRDLTRPTREVAA